MGSLMEQTAELLFELFDYNRENFKNDRKQRQLFEYQLANMRIDQAKLWRRDIRDIANLTPAKMEVYLLVIALELGFCITALCKGRVPPGAPVWLVAVHTLAICAAIMYLFLALWFGMHAFVSAQAYKVRILTQLVRLPVPKWQTLEAARTYSSAFEKQSVTQMVRVPFLRGTWRQRAAAALPPPAPPAADALEGPPRAAAESAQDGGGASAASAAEPPVASDPWGLERQPEGISELAADVNTRTERQRHIWLVREAARYYQTYDAFCRVSMGVGTSCLSTFFCYYCLSYVLTENAAPVAAWAGMVVFSSCALVLMRQDLLLEGWQYLILSLLKFLGPFFSAIVTFHSSKNAGDPGAWEYLMPPALLCHAAWLLYFVLLFRVRESTAGSMLPMAFRSILFLDAFAWVKHDKKKSTVARSLLDNRPFQRQRTSFSRGLARFAFTGSSQRAAPAPAASMPSMDCANAATPMRPEDLETAAGDSSPASSNPHLQDVSFRPGSFGVVSGDSVVDEEFASGHDNSTLGDTPGLLPWRIFLFNTIILALLWICAAVVAANNAYKGTAIFVRERYHHGKPSNVNLLQGTRLATTWGDDAAGAGGFGASVAPHSSHGLACSADGSLLATLGVLPSGSRGILVAKLEAESAEKSAKQSWRRKRGPTVSFLPASRCGGLEALEQEGLGMRDLSLHGCQSDSGCSALVLPRLGDRLVSCPVAVDGNATSDAELSDLRVGISKHWLDADDDELENEQHQEQLSSLETVPCGDEDCAVVGTTAQRVVQLTSVPRPAALPALQAPSRAPKHLAPQWSLREAHGEPAQAGSLARLGASGRHLAMLHHGDNVLHVVDVQEGGAQVGTWRLQRDASSPVPDLGGDGPAPWSAICASASHLFALEAQEPGREPSLWRFPLPMLGAKGRSPPKAEARNADDVAI
eukprot:TRINITY_DN26273_c0_g3_i1.p1 TRINITY_DN26273_c0_g3~~TRINITY_DN26273_c0_g3_i1.p1  ORF type:complete len:925 (+),score=200.19 TRINITY_DN26273_c0_g3_i1:350-3124(+)